MKAIVCLFVLLSIILCCSFMGIVMADEEVETIVAQPEVIALEIPDVKPPAGSLIWEFLNSALGISFVVSMLSVIIGKIFTAKPAWKQYVLKYGPKLMQAVKMAEKRIPNDTPNKGIARLDEALKYIIEIEPKLGKAYGDDLRQALTAVHAAAETNGNLNES